MKKTSLIVLAIIATFGIALALDGIYQLGTAHADAGSAIGLAGSAAITAIDPTQDPGGFLGELGAAKKAGWPVLIGLLAFGLCKAFAMLLPALNKGRTAIAIAGGASIAAALIAAGTGAASWSALLGALVSAVVAFVDFKAPAAA